MYIRLSMKEILSRSKAHYARKNTKENLYAYSDFSLITQNLVAMGENLQGVDLTDVKQWTPEDYVDEQINGE